MFLRKTITVGGKRVTIGRALESAATRRVTSGVTSGAYSGSELATAIEHAVVLGRKISMPITAEGLAASIAKLLPDVTAGSFDPGAILQQLAKATPDQRKVILQEAFGGGGGFKDFDEAIAAATTGRWRRR